MIRGAVVIVSLSLAAAAGTHLWHPAAPVWYLAQVEAGLDEVTLSEVTTRWAGKVQWVDARVQARFDAGHIPGAIMINEQNRDDAVFEHLDKLQSARLPIVIYCDSLKCQSSHKIRDFLSLNVALPEVWVLTGGWPAWQAAHP